MPSGKYNFNIQAMSVNGKWSIPLKYKFKILPAWYNTHLAYSMYTIIVVVLLWLLFQLKIVFDNKKLEERYQAEMIKQIQFEEGRQLEKDRIALELYDSILGNLFGIRMGLGFIDMDVDSETNKLRENYLNELSTLETDIRNITHDLSPHIGISGLAYAKVTEEYLIKYSDRHNIEYDTRINWAKVDNSIKFNLLRIIKEASHNTLKYAKASKFCVEFEMIENTIKLVIKDNGLGFNSATTRRGIGMQNITTRVDAINGKVFFRNSKPKGAAIIIRVPYYSNN